MTSDTLNEIFTLINKQENDLTILKSAIDIALGESFLEHQKITIHSHLCMVDEYVDRIKNTNKEIMKFLSFYSGN